jgi:hypothetical protein
MSKLVHNEFYHARESGHPARHASREAFGANHEERAAGGVFWIPAYAGMTPKEELRTP